MKKILWITGFSLLILQASLPAQGLDDLAGSYRGENGQGYMQPLGDVFGASLNSGLYHSARIPKNGFHLRFGVHSMTAFIGDDQRTFSAQTQDHFIPQQSAPAPTVFGSTEGAVVYGEGGTAFLFPGGMDIKRLPLAAPQVTIGAVMGTESTLRYIQVNLDDNFDQLTLLGYGLRHSISQYFPALRFDIAAAIFLQNFKIGDIVDASSMHYGIQASKTAGVATLYGGFGLGSSKMDIQYEYNSNEAPETIRFELESGTKTYFNAGISFHLLVLYLFADYTIGAQNILSLGMGFGL